ncbi:SulP family inorganic anion transporter [Pseudomonas matsuisoli]|uniref:Sulfate transporter n=1 Tax=Pseudomonas matsuisoli TaxID=1515666 RepID=A0A917Q3G0_9PSED|nr:SulP family inorganic anion transporter [Pseudomonas matsuisoli]GGK10541.1 sulfate transporter [Pseudomonas matsuisoli]
MRAPRLTQLFPWFALVDRFSWRHDMSAGLLGAVLALPQGVAFATLAGLPPQYGVYGAVVPCIIAALAGSSRHVVTGPTNANSLALMAALSPLALVGSAHYIDLALAVTIMVGLLQLLVGGFRLGALANFISPSVLLGFTSGAAVLIALFALKDFLGLALPPGTSAFGILAFIAMHPGEIHWQALLVGAVTLAATLALRRWRPRWPTMLLGLLAGFACAQLLSVIQRAHAGIEIVGPIPSALPPFHVPDVNMTALGELSSIALALTLVALGQSLSIAKAVAARSGQTLDVNREFVGQGLANAIGGLFSSYVSCGSLNRSMPNLQAGAKTPLAAVFAAVLVVVLVAFGGGLIELIPLAAIAATLLLVAYGLVDVQRWKEVLAVSRTESVVAGVTFFATLSIPLDRAVLLGTLVSLVAYLYRTSHPAIRPLLPATHTPERRFTPIEELPLPHGEECPQLKLVRVEGSVYFGAAQHVSDQLQLFRRQKPEQRHALFMVKSMNFIDLAGNDLWRHEMQERRACGGDIFFHRPRTPVMQMFAQTGLLEKLGDGHIFSSKDQALRSIYEHLDINVCRTCTARVFKECQSRAEASDELIARSDG